MTTHLMIDIETMGVRPDAVLLEIGAVVFTADFHMSHRTHIAVDTNSCQELGATICPSTRRWWDEQGGYQAPQYASFAPVSSAIEVLRRLYIDNQVDYVWAKGPQFDLVIIETYLKKMHRAPIWRYSRVCDLRTALMMPGSKGARLDRPPVSHNALDDAEQQVLDLAHAYPEGLDRE